MWPPKQETSGTTGFNPLFSSPNDTVAQAKWNSIKGSIPLNISVKGTIKGNFSGFTPNYRPLDLHCLRSFDKCSTPNWPVFHLIIAIPEPNSLGYRFDDGPNCSHNAFYDFLTQQ
jgi:hypothetical protein